MRIYWSGAAMMLQADMALRERTNGAQSLDTALARLRDCCWEEGKLWRAKELLQTLDQLTGTDVFLTVYEANVGRLAFPDIDETFDRLGLETRNGRVRLVEGAPLGDVRDDIMLGVREGSLSPRALDSAP